MKNILIAALTLITTSVSASECENLLQLGDTIYDLSENPQTLISENTARLSYEGTLFGERELISHIGEFEAKYCQDAITVDDITFAGKTFQLVYTIEDHCDGGNSYGYILEEGRLIGTIQDSDLYCL